MPAFVQHDVVKAVAEAIYKTADTGLEGITNPINWPNSAVLGVEYSYRDRQFPDVEQSVNTIYFDYPRDLHSWIEDKKQWVKGTDYDFSISYSVYAWDLGPRFRYSNTV